MDHGLRGGCCSQTFKNPPRELGAAPCYVRRGVYLCAAMLHRPNAYPQCATQLRWRRQDLDEAVASARKGAYRP